MKLEIPEALRLREAAICTGLHRAAETGGETGQAAELLEDILLPHLAKERVDILEPLALLPRLAKEEVALEMAKVLPQIQQLASELHALRVEHATILSAIKRLVAAAREEGKSRHTRFAERLLFRAWLDESIFSPLAILIGKYLQLRLHSCATFADAPSSGKAIKFELPEALRFNRAALSSALSESMRAGGQTAIAAKAIAQLWECHLQNEDAEVLRILGLLEPLAAGAIDPRTIEDYSELKSIEPNAASLRQEHAALTTAAEKLLTTARAEGVDEMVEFGERLLLRIRLDEEIFYPAALLVRSYLKLKRRRQPSPKVFSFAKTL